MAKLTKALQINVGNASAQIQYSDDVTEQTLREVVETFIRWQTDSYNFKDINVYKLHGFRPYIPETPEAVEPKNVGGIL